MRVQGVKIRASGFPSSKVPGVKGVLHFGALVLYLFVFLCRRLQRIIFIDDNEKARLIVNNFPWFTAWKFIKLQEVTISTSNKNAYSPGHITIVENG